jgi:hypothetical protein
VLGLSFTSHTNIGTSDTKLDTLSLLFASRFVFGILKITMINQWNHIISSRDMSGEDGAELVLIYYANHSKVQIYLLPSLCGYG